MAIILCYKLYIKSHNTILDIFPRRRKSLNEPPKKKIRKTKNKITSRRREVWRRTDYPPHCSRLMTAQHLGSPENTHCTDMPKLILPHDSPLHTPVVFALYWSEPSDPLYQISSTLSPRTRNKIGVTSYGIFMLHVLKYQPQKDHNVSHAI